MLLEIKNLSIEYVVDKVHSKAVNDVSLEIAQGETLGLVGETGAGKTTTALGIMNLVPNPPGRITGGQILYKGTDLLKMSDHQMESFRGNEISMIFQDPMTALNPVMTVGDQIREVLQLHQTLSHSEANQKVREMLELVGIEGARYNEYPHQFSGGMKQRIVIAIAIACEPALLLADEPTTALDVTIQAQVLKLIDELKAKLNSSMLLITHDLGVVAETCDKVAIMYAGSILEYGDMDAIYNHASHPYTVGLFGSLPSLEADTERLTPIPGLMPDPAHLPVGCVFADRCKFAEEACRAAPIALTEYRPGHKVRCRRVEEIGR